MHDVLYRIKQYIRQKNRSRLARRRLRTATNEAEHSSSPAPATPGTVFLRHFPSCTPFRVYHIPQAKVPRVSLLTDSINSGSLYGGVGTAVLLGLEVAKTIGGKLRIVTRTEAAAPQHLARFLRLQRYVPTEEIEFTYLSLNRKSRALDLLKDELLVTTSWWSTLAALKSVPKENLIYLLQDDERIFYPLGDERISCEEVLRTPGLRFVINSSLLKEHFRNEGLISLWENSTHFEPAFPDHIYYKKTGKVRTRRLLFYAHPQNPRNLFHLGLRVLEEGIRRQILNTEVWKIIFVGKDLPAVEFCDGTSPKRFENMPWDEYAALVREVDIGLALMHAPHPSYPPLDVAASGGIAVSTSYGIKQDLARYSSDVLLAPPTVDGLVGALQKAIEEIEKRACGTADAPSSFHLPRSWNATLEPVARWIAEGRETR
ncbi:hypothetical protein [Schlegelella aquatica]|uniref:rhamnosyltransferase WsaF family glycosyltransferase n=1 Tax=Caldimonas aquatica TaxID=376175 RepID=UPI0037537280